MADLEKTGTPGIFRRHRKECDARDRCKCPWVITWRHRGKQYKETCGSFNEARQRKASHESGDLEPRSKTKFGDYFPEWIESYSGLTSRGFSETTRPEYRRPIDNYAMPAWKNKRLSDIERGDVRRLFMTLRKDGKSTSVIKKLRVALSALFETAIEDELVRHNPAKGVRIPAPLTEEAEDDERPKALTRRELSALLAKMTPEWRLFFEFLTHTDSGSRRRSGSTGDRSTWVPNPTSRCASRSTARQAQEAEDPEGAQGPSAFRRNGRPPSGSSRELGWARGRPGVRIERRHHVDPGQSRQGRPLARHRRSWPGRLWRRGRVRAVSGDLPYLPPHLRLLALRARA